MCLLGVLLGTSRPTPLIRRGSSPRCATAAEGRALRNPGPSTGSSCVFRALRQRPTRRGPRSEYTEFVALLLTSRGNALKARPESRKPSGSESKPSTRRSKRPVCHPGFFEQRSGFWPPPSPAPNLSCVRAAAFRVRLAIEQISLLHTPLVGGHAGTRRDPARLRGLELQAPRTGI